MISFIFWTILLYLLFRFVFGFLIPVISASRQMRVKMRNMQEQMNSQFGTQQQDATTSFADASQAKSSSNKPGGKPPKDDYIDFEEVK